MLEKAYVLKTADRIITSNCKAHFKNSILIIKTDTQEPVTEVCLNTDAVTHYEITFSKGSNKITTYGAAQSGMTLIRRNRREIIVTPKNLPRIY
jgi:hypothetical protein